MNERKLIDSGLSVLESRLDRLPTSIFQQPLAPRPFITLGRETGAGATTTGQTLVPLLDEAFKEQGQGWVFLDKNLLTHALASRHLPERLAQHLPEDKVSEIKSMIGELVGLHPSLWELEHKVAEAILQLAHMGHVVIAGRAAYLMTRSLPAGFHVKLVAPLETRINRVMRLLGCSADAAARHIRNADRGRRRFVRARFGQDVDDPQLYDLVINTERLLPGAVARIIMEGLRSRLADLERRPGATGSTSPFVIPAGGI
jgi:cytidylate kinase